MVKTRFRPGSNEAGRIRETVGAMAKCSTIWNSRIHYNLDQYGIPDWGFHTHTHIYILYLFKKKYKYIYISVSLSLSPSFFLFLFFTYMDNIDRYLVLIPKKNKGAWWLSRAFETSEQVPSAVENRFIGGCILGQSFVGTFNMFTAW
jgi:hypothetical protein